MTLEHWLYIIGVIAVVLTMIFRRNVVIPCVLFTFLIGWSFHASFIEGVITIFTASLTAAKELFSIFLIIGLMVAMLKSLTVAGADQLLVQPLKGLMVSPVVSYLVIILATVLISLFFWPTPAVPLIGALLVPPAVAAGLPPMMGAMALALAGQGMTLAGDVIIQGAPGLTAASAGVPVQNITYAGGVLTVISGVIALVLAWIMNRGEIANFKPGEMHLGENAPADVQSDLREEARSKGPLLAWILLIAMAGVVVSLFAFDIKGGDASALLGGVALLVMLVAVIYVDAVEGLDKMADYIADGLVFAFRVMGPIIPIAGFFFLGSPESVGAILRAEDAPGYLFDVGEMIADVIPTTGFLGAFGMLILGAITGLDGSGFSGLPLVGTLAGAMAGGNEAVATALGAVGQMGSIWVGGGTLVAWSSLVAVAGITGVPVLDLVRRNLIPVVAGLIVSTIVAVLFMM